MFTNQLRLIALCLGSASSILAQSGTFRPTPTSVILDFAANVDHIITLRLVVLGNPAGTGSVADLSTQATVKGQDIAITLTNPQVQAPPCQH